MRTLRLVSAYLFSIFLFAVLFPALETGVGLWLDRLFGFEPLRHGVVSIVFGTLVILCGLFWMVWSWYSLLTIGRGHPQEVFGFPLAPRTKRLVIVGPYSYTRNPMLFGLLLLLVGWGIILGSVSATLFLPLILVVLLLLHFKFFEEPGLWRRFGEEYEDYRHQVPLILPFKRRVG
ncbi:MAG: methyltransferase family protein [Anaerolineae bacterium]